jgi:broad specificity phosphatase PhoE
MVSSDSIAQEESSAKEPLHRKDHKPVHIYPYKIDIEALQANGQYATVKRFHVVRHAEGTHNVNQAYKDIVNLDARLTGLGKEQCYQLAKTLEKAQAKLDQSCPHYRLNQHTELIVTSPLTRCMETAMLSFPKLTSAIKSDPNKIPFVAHESIRETVNYASDRRRAISELEKDFQERICFREIEHDHDEIWDSYLRRVGPPEEYGAHRESAELHKVADRARDFFRWVRTRPEKEIVVCTHSAFLRCFLNFGLPGGVPLLVSQILDGRENVDKEIPVVEYHGDLDFEKYMRGDYDNCELRSFVAAFPH